MRYQQKTIILRKFKVLKNEHDITQNTVFLLALK